MELFFISFVFVLASSVAEIIGFGVSTVSMILLPMLLPLTVAIPLVAILSLIANGIISFKSRQKSIVNNVFPLLTGSASGVFFGMKFLDFFDLNILTKVMGIFLILYAIFGLFGSLNFLGSNKRLRLLIGFIAGFFSASFNIHGPLVGAYESSHGQLSKIELKNLISTYLFFTGIFTVFGHFFSHHITKDVFSYAIFSLPSIFMGLLVGSRLFKKIEMAHIKNIVYVFVLISGVIFVYFK